MRVLYLLNLVLLVAACSTSAEAGLGDGGAVDSGQQPGVDAAEPAQVTGKGRVVGGALNLRAGPSTETEVLALIPLGAIIDLLGDASDGWYPARHDGIDGYVSADFILPLEDGAEAGGLLNLLPWEPGTSYRVTGGHNQFSHVGVNLWAWDFGMAVGTPVLATHNGVVRMARGDSTTGCCDPSCSTQANYVILSRGDGIESAYVHLSAAYVEAGDVVTRGDVIGASGQTGYSCGAHLHFQMQAEPSDKSTRYGQSVQDVFYDIGEAFDPPQGSEPVSQNGVLDLP